MLVIGRMQIKVLKITINYLIPITMATNKTSENNKCWQTYGEMETLVHCWWKCKMVQALCKILWHFLEKLRIGLLYELAIPLLGIYQN